MKKLCSMVMTVILLCMLSVTASAEEKISSASSQKESTNESTPKINNTNTVETSPKEPASQPKVIVNGHSINPSPVMAGEKFTVKVTLKNTSDEKSVRNMTVTASFDCPNISLLNSSNTFYIKKLDRNKTAEILLKYKSDAVTPPQRYDITLSIEYENDEAVSFSSRGTVSVEVDQPMHIEMETPRIASEVNAGDTLPVSFQVMNLGHGKAYNVRCILKASGLIPSGTTFVGNMEAGTSSTGEMDVFIGTKDMTGDYDGGEKYGPTSGKITLLYEDESGKQYTKESEFSTNINTPVINENPSKPEEKPARAGQWWISIVIGAAIIEGLFAFFMIRSKRRGKFYEEV